MLLVGLGNPGTRYRDTRHNVGFVVVEQFVETLGGAAWRQKFQGQLADVSAHGERLWVLKPETYVNRSGECVGQAARFYKIAPPDVLVVHDELDLPFGRVRLKQGGGVAGHNGLKSITSALGSNDYLRLRLGVGRPGPEFSGKGADYVLQAFASEEQTLLGGVIRQASDAISDVLKNGLSAAMNRVNRRNDN
jgi:PTH1 family peptidyl-tRNA hydrolase